MLLIKSFLSGMLLFNAIPHLVQGIRGKKHMTPISPESSGLTNVIWGWINLFLGYLLLPENYFSEWSTLSLCAFGAGGFIISVWLSVFWSNPDARLPWHKN